MMGEGQSDKQIVDYLVARYGDFVLYNPPVEARTLLLWYGPWALLGGGLLVLLIIVVRKRKVESAPQKALLSAEEQQRLSQLLDKKDS
jgi:cytochrome c-type biogenesis protein CcmH